MGLTPPSGTGPPAVVLVSGGLDSATALAIAIAEGYSAHALSVDYGQRHAVEIAAARRVCASMGVTAHTVIAVDLRAFGGSALTDEIAVPHHERADEVGSGIPVTYVPARNTIFLSLALAWCEVLGSNDIFIGVNAVDYSGYPDCRPEYLAAFEAMANLATKAAVEGRQRVRVRAPLSNLSKAQIIKRGLELGVDYSVTHSCYEPGPAGEACGTCDSCLLRAKGFSELGLADPASAPARRAPSP